MSKREAVKELSSRFGLTEKEAKAYLRLLAKTTKVKIGVCSDCGAIVVACPKCGKPHHVDEAQAIGVAKVRLWFSEDKGFVEISRRDFLKLGHFGDMELVVMLLRFPSAPDWEAYKSDISQRIATEYAQTVFRILKGKEKEKK